MNEKMNLKEMEKKAYRFTFQDGIYDIMFGVLFVSFALAPIIREVIGLSYILFLVIPAPLLFTLAKKYIRTPRIGIVKFGQKRRTAQKKLVTMSVILVRITFILLIMTITNIFPGTFGTMLDGIVASQGDLLSEAQAVADKRKLNPNEEAANFLRRQ